MRRYTNRLNGSAASILLVCGRPGPVSVHTPDVCYEGDGFDLLGPPVRYAVQASSPSEPAEFWAATVNKQSPTAPLRLRILWSWNATGTWKAPDNPRPTFARFPVLYKLYVVREVIGADERLEEERYDDLIRQLLLEIEEVIHPRS